MRAGQRRRLMVRMLPTVFLLIGQSGRGFEPQCAHAQSNSSTTDWPRLFGPNGDSVVPPQPLKLDWPGGQPKRLWSMRLGEGYSSPVIVASRLLAFHRVGDEEVLDCFDANTQERLWRFSYPTTYVDQYGYNNGPRATPVVVDGMVYTLGAEGKLFCIRFDDGKEVWRRWLNVEYEVDSDFFGVAGSPLVDGDRIIVNVGGAENEAGIVAIDRHSGKTLWTSTSDGPSYATPVAATIHARRYVFVFTKAGLVSVDPADGNVQWSIPFRSKLYESVNATSPIVVDDLVFASATYGTGSLCVRVRSDGTYEQLWRSERAMDSHFSNLIAVDGFVYGFSGRHEPNAELRCIELKTGRVLWSVPSILGRGSMIRAGETTLLWGERGHLFARNLSPETTPELPEDPHGATSLLRYPCWTPPVIADGRLYLRNESEIVCYDLSSE